MITVTTVRTGESVTLAYPTQPTARAILARVGRIDLRDAHTTFLGFVLDTLADEPTLPQRQASSEGSPSQFALARLRDMQIFKDEHGMLRCPLGYSVGCGKAPIF